MRLDPRNINLKLPTLKRTGGGSKRSGFLGNLYADLRDRRLLIPLVALVAALVAVPVLLKSEPEVAPPATAVDVDDAAAVTPAVLVDSPGVRSYRKRLATLKRTNPFSQQFTTTAEDAEVEVQSGESDPSVSVAGGEITETASASSGSAGGSATAEVTVSDEPSSPVESPSAPADDGSTDESQAVDPEPGQTVYYTGTADITFGPLGKAKRYRGLKRFEMLPDEKTPVIAFLGLSVDADRAYFLVSNEVTETSGDGNCSPQRPAPCQLLELGVGDQRTLVAGLDQAVTYRLRLTDTDVQEISDPGSRKVSDAK